ncbi:cora-domain-containing protein [Tothia fuscella]|uniref:Cora-domain-containing protein n=1 Tax=Tothia fuscella TaxID=1048955 RepID=A0A9P4NZZ3_9PEZI|nr:cora-domain-containing protein [Tothia fuscella]
MDLDDHRRQPESLPRHEHTPRNRRGTLASIYDARPDLLRVDAALRDEQVIVDDDNLLVSPTEGQEQMFLRRGSVSPAVARKSTNRRQKANASRESSSSRSTSPSPPNSVHAFAESSRRRGRSGTINSKAPSINNLELQRTNSKGSGHSRRSRRSRRPTFSGRSDDGKNDSDSGHSSAEDDVCYPQSEDSKDDDGSIDFSDLEEFVQEEQEAREAGNDNLTTPKIRVQEPSPHRTGSMPVATDDDFSDLEKTQVERVPTLSTDPHASKADLVKRWWTFFSSELDDTIHATTIGGLLEEGETFRQLFDMPSEGGCFWLDAVNPTEDEVAALCKAFGVHPLTREDIVTQESREKIELFKKYYFVSSRSFNHDKDHEDYLEDVSVYAVVFRNGLLTFCFNQNPHTANVLKRMRRLRDYMQLSADWICYALIDDIVDCYLPAIRDIEVQTDSIEDQVFSARPEDARAILRAIAECRKRCLVLLRLLQIKPDVIKGFAKRCNEGFQAAPRGDVGLYLSDIQDHVVTMRDNLTHSEQLLSRLHNNFLAQVNVDHISQGNNVNKVLGKVTLIATILVPLNLVTGLFGMNVGEVPGKNSTGLGWFFGIMGFLFAFAFICVVVAKKLKWF